MKNKSIRFVFPVLTGFFLLASGFSVFANGNSNHKVTICHATSSETNPYVRIVVDRHAIKGHFYENGTPLAGHEEDILIGYVADCPSPTPSVSPTPSPSASPKSTPSPTPSPSPSPTPTPSVSPSPSPTSGGNTNNNENTNGQNQSQTQNNNQTVNVTVQGQVLNVKTPKVQPETGASTLALATMFGAAPFGLLLRRFSSSKKRVGNLGEFASRLIAGKNQG